MKVGYTKKEVKEKRTPSEKERGNMKGNKRRAIVAFLLAIGIFLSMIGSKQTKVAAEDRSIVEEAQWGTVDWILYDDGELLLKEGILTYTGAYARPNWEIYINDIISITFDGEVVAKDNSYLFGNLPNLTTVNNIENLKATGDMTNLFYSCGNLENIDVSNWDTSAITMMSDMFMGCGRLLSLDVSNWDTSNVIDMTGVFTSCVGLSTLDVSNWETSNVERMGFMFAGCINLVSLDVSRWDTSGLVSAFCMFSGCHRLTNLDVSHWNMSNIDNGNWLKDGLQGMFDSCHSLTSLDLSHWDTTNVEGMAYMLAGCNELKSLKLGERFSFKIKDSWTACLPNPNINSGQYTGRWIGVTTGIIYEDSEALMAEYDGTPDTYVWEQNYYDILFETNGVASVAPERVNKGDTITKPIGVEKEGYELVWHANEILTNPWDFDQTPRTDMTLYAEWRANKYSIKYDGNGATAGSMEEDKVTYNDEITLTKNAYIKEGHSFKGWSTIMNGSVDYLDEANIEEWQLVEDLELYAIWEKNAVIDQEGIVETSDATIMTGWILLMLIGGFTIIGLQKKKSDWMNKE